MYALAYYFLCKWGFIFSNYQFYSNFVGTRTTPIRTAPTRTAPTRIIPTHDRAFERIIYNVSFNSNKPRLYCLSSLVHFFSLLLCYNMELSWVGIIRVEVVLVPKTAKCEITQGGLYLKREAA